MKKLDQIVREMEINLEKSKKNLEDMVACNEQLEQILVLLDGDKR